MSFQTVRSYMLYFFSLLVVVFFLPFTQDFFTLPKWYLVGFFALALLLSSMGEFLYTKKITWNKKELDSPLTLFLVAASLSILFGSVNKVQALLSPHFGLLTFVFLFIIYYYFSRSHKTISHGDIIFSLFDLVRLSSNLAECIFFVLHSLLHKTKNDLLFCTRCWIIHKDKKWSFK